MECVKVMLMSLPCRVHGLTVYYMDTDGQEYYTILLNSHDSAERNCQTYDHEIKHINNGDFDMMIPIEELETERHSNFKNIV